MKRKYLLIFATLLATAVLADDHHANPQQHPEGKLFRWVDARAGDCHLDGTLIIRPNGTATFDSQIWTHTHGNDVWHSEIFLGPHGEFGRSGNHNSPGMPHNNDGPGHKVTLHYDFNFNPGDFVKINEVFERGSC